jgi:hypothetical protein
MDWKVKAWEAEGFRHMARIVPPVNPGNSFFWFVAELGGGPVVRIGDAGSFEGARKEAEMALAVADEPGGDR